MCSLEKVMKLAHGAVGPPEPLGRVPEVGHDEAVLPPALDRTRTTQVRRGWRTVMDCSKPEITAYNKVL